MTKQQVQLNTNAADVSENDLRERYPEALEVLLRDHTTGKDTVALEVQIDNLVNQLYGIEQCDNAGEKHQ